MAIEYVGQLTFGGIAYPYFEFRVPAGFPSPAQDHLEQQISLDELFNLRAPHVFLCRVSGDSMKDVGIFDTDIALVDRSIPVRSGCIVVASLNNEDLIKRYCKEGDDQVVLRAENPAYGPRYLMENDQLLVAGVVRYSVRCHDDS